MAASVARNKNTSFLPPWASINSTSSISRTTQGCAIGFDGFSPALALHTSNFDAPSHVPSTNQNRNYVSKSLELQKEDAFSDDAIPHSNVDNSFKKTMSNHQNSGQVRNEKSSNQDDNDGLKDQNQEQTDLSNDSCPGLFDYIRRRKKLKPHRCSRCGLTHSNFVKANKASSTNRSYARLLRISRSNSCTTNNKVIVICQNCGKRSYTQSTFSRQLLHPSFSRSMTWPLPLEQIVEDDTEDCRVDKNFFLKSGQKTFDELTGLVSSNTDNSENRINSTANPVQSRPHVPIPGVDAAVVKVLIGCNNKKILPFIHGLNRWANDRTINFRFLAMTSEGSPKLSPKFESVIESNIVVKEYAIGGIYSDERAFLEAAERSKVKMVLVDDSNSDSDHNLINKLIKSGFHVLQPGRSNQREKSNELVIVVPETNSEKSLFIRILSPAVLPPTCDDKVAKVESEANHFNFTALLFTAVHVAYRRHQNREETYKAALQRAEILLPTCLFTTDQIDIFHASKKYNITVTRIAPTTFLVNLGSWGPALVQTGRPTARGLSFTYNGINSDTLFEELSNSYRITVDKKVFVFGKHNSCNLDEKRIELPKISHPFASDHKDLDSYSTEKSNETLRSIPEAKQKRSSKILSSSRECLNLLMAGWCCGEKRFEEETMKTVNDMMTALNDPSLPLHELQEVMLNISSVLPPAVEQKICRELSRYSSNITSMMSQFPTEKILKILDCYAAYLTKEFDKSTFQKISKPLLDVVCRYREGIRGYMESEISSFIRMYLKVESKFQKSSFNSCVRAMMEDGEEVDQIMEDVRSHSQLPRKNFLILQLLKRLSTSHYKYSDGVISALEDVSSLLDEGTVQVALEARRILRKSLHVPHELRYNQLNSIFLSLSSREEEVMSSLSESDLFEVLPQFFCHSDLEVQMASLEVFVRRIYSCFELHSVQHRSLPPSYPALVFHFSSPFQSSDGCPMVSASTITSGLSVFAAYPDLLSLDSNFRSVLQLFNDPGSVCQDLNDFTSSVPEVEDSSRKLTSLVRSLNVAIVAPDDVSDHVMSDRLLQFMQVYKMQISEAGIELVTFAVHRVNETVKFYSFHSTVDAVGEDLHLRYIHPALFSRLNINLSDCHHLQALSSSKQHLHFFQRCSEDEDVLIRTAVPDLVDCDRRNSLSVLDEIEFLLLEAVAELEKLSSHHGKKSSLFINFLPQISWSKADAEEKIRSLVHRFGDRLWRKRLTDVRIKLNIKCGDGQADSCEIQVKFSSPTNISVCLG